MEHRGRLDEADRIEPRPLEQRGVLGFTAFAADTGTEHLVALVAPAIQDALTAESDRPQ